MLLCATQSLAEDLNDESVLCLGPQKGLIMRMLLAPWKIEERNTYFYSLIKSQKKPNSNESFPKSLVIEEAYQELCGTIATKALEVIFACFC